MPSPKHKPYIVTPTVVLEYACHATNTDQKVSYTYILLQNVPENVSTLHRHVAQCPLSTLDGTPLILYHPPTHGLYVSLDIIDLNLFTSINQSGDNLMQALPR